VKSTISIRWHKLVREIMFVNTSPAARYRADALFPSGTYSLRFMHTFTLDRRFLTRRGVARNFYLWIQNIPHFYHDWSTKPQKPSRGGSKYQLPQKFLIGFVEISQVNLVVAGGPDHWTSGLQPLPSARIAYAAESLPPLQQTTWPCILIGEASPPS